MRLIWVRTKAEYFCESGWTQHLADLLLRQFDPLSANVFWTGEYSQVQKTRDRMCPDYRAVWPAYRIKRARFHQVAGQRSDISPALHFKRPALNHANLLLTKSHGLGDGLPMMKHRTITRLRDPIHSAVLRLGP